MSFKLTKVWHKYNTLITMYVMKKSYENIKTSSLNIHLNVFLLVFFLCFLFFLTEKVIICVMKFLKPPVVIYVFSLVDIK